MIWVRTYGTSKFHALRPLSRWRTSLRSLGLRASNISVFGLLKKRKPKQDLLKVLLFCFLQHSGHFISGFLQHKKKKERKEKLCKASGIQAAAYYMQKNSGSSA